MVKPETHAILKDFKSKVIDEGFKPPPLPVYNKDFFMHEIDLTLMTVKDWKYINHKKKF